MNHVRKRQWWSGGFPESMSHFLLEFIFEKCWKKLVWSLAKWGNLVKNKITTGSKIWSLHKTQHTFQIITKSTVVIWKPKSAIFQRMGKCLWENYGKKFYVGISFFETDKTPNLIHSLKSPRLKVGRKKHGLNTKNWHHSSMFFNTNKK